MLDCDFWRAVSEFPFTKKNREIFTDNSEFPINLCISKVFMSTMIRNEILIRTLSDFFHFKAKE